MCTLEARSKEKVNSKKHLPTSSLILVSLTFSQFSNLFVYSSVSLSFEYLYIASSSSSLSFSFLPITLRLSREASRTT